MENVKPKQVRGYHGISDRIKLARGRKPFGVHQDRSQWKHRYELGTAYRNVLRLKGRIRFVLPPQKGHFILTGIGLTPFFAAHTASAYA